MIERTFAQAAELMAGEIVAGDPATRFRGAAIDSRKVEAGAVFFALPGERTDGHAFAGAALERGASGVVFERGEATGAGVWLRVENTFQALHDLTRGVRRQVPRQLVGITGSVGKTTTKELAAAMLARRYRTAGSPGNLNNLYGFPLALLSMDEDLEWMVAEMGMSTPGELRRLSLLARPDVAVYTNVRPAHLASFGDLRAIADAKAELLAGIPADGVVIANDDDPWVMRIAAQHGGRVVRYGYGEHAEVRATDARPAERGVGVRFTLTAAGDRVEVALPVHGLYNVDNCLAAAACAHTLGVPLDDVAAAAAAFAPAAGARMRGDVVRLAGGATVIDDTYNANPDACVRALESAAAVAAERRLAILGDMLELGPEAPSFHRQVGARAAALGFAQVIGVGPLARHLVAAARAGGAGVEWFADAAAAASALAAQRAAGAFGEGDLVLVKGSRGMRLERVVEALRAAAAGGGEAA